MIRPITFEEQIVGSRNDGGVYRNIYPHDGILWGCGITVTSTQIEIASGMFVLGGRMIWVDGKTVFEVKNPIQNGYARLKAKIDLNAATSQEECGQFATEIEFSTTELFPTLTQEDINSTGKIYEQELAVVKIEAGNVTGIVKKLENAGIDAEKLGGETPGYYAARPEVAVFGITNAVSYPINIYQQVVLNKTIINNIDGCTLNISTGNVMLPAGTYIANGFVTFGGTKTEANVSIYLKNPMYTEGIKNRANIGYVSDPSNVDKTINVTTLFTIQEPAITFMGARVSESLSLQSAAHYTHLEIVKIG